MFSFKGIEAQLSCLCNIVILLHLLVKASVLEYKYSGVIF